MVIDVSKLTESDVGRAMIYRPHHGGIEHGILSSFNDNAVFVRFLGPNGERCDPRCLDFAVDGEGKRR